MAVLALGQSLSADDYYNYGTWTPDGLSAIYDVTGYIDTNGKLGEAENEYVIFNNNGIGYIYRVNVAGDPNMHPDNPLATGPVAERSFTFVSKSPFSLPSWGGQDEFYVEESGIYFGSGNSIKKWDFNWENETDIISNGNLYSETLAYNKTKHEWWSTTGGRAVYKYNNDTSSWEYQFTHPNLAGGHHDGMEIVDNTLYLSDMTSDKVVAYELNASGAVSDPTDYQIFTYTASPVVEGMGYGPNEHFWIGGGYLYEIGEGNLTTSCTQTFNYTTNWTMQRSKCDNIKVPGFDDTIMAKMVDGKLVYATADAGAKAWLEGLNCNVTVVDELTLKTGEGIWLVSKSDISKTVNTGQSRNNFVNFVNGAYTFVGFNVAVDLNSKFDATKIASVYYYNNGSWHTWTPANGSLSVEADQGLYVFAKDDFSMTVK